ncbi:MAG: glycoside hydrolase family 57, partial [Spartobacteria bacterium]|nr:glycoside hydrolase family 57 [Spartobacteria bacterium]
MANEVFHATVLNLHQPPGNLDYLLKNQEWSAKEVLYAMDRIPRSVWGYEDVARVHLVMSGSLLETLSSPGFQSQVYGIVKCGDLLWNLRHPSIDFLATGYYHPVMPLTPEADRIEHVERWLKIGRHLFDRQRFYGFWPPEMGFCMEMIPMLKKAGFRYVLVDSEHVEPLEAMRWEEVRYRPHIAKYDGEEIIVVVRDRDLSNAQESGMDIGWFMYEVEERTRWCDFPALVTTCSDGDNGGWFRNTNMAANYWGAFYKPLMDKVRKNEAGFSPAFIHEYLNMYGAEGEVKVHTGAWNTG